MADLKETKLPYRHDVAHVYVEDACWRGAHVVIDQGVLTVSLWLDEEEYDKANAALRAAGWHCVKDLPNACRWKPTKEGMGSPLWIKKNEPPRRKP